MKLVHFLLLLTLLSLSGPAHASAELDAQGYFRKATAALEGGAWNEAIDNYELLADHGFHHPDASFNRALAYVHRAESSRAEPGDLGRAAAAFSETLLLRPDDNEAREGLRLVREEIGRRRARQGAEQVVVSPSLSRTAVGLLGETTWAILAALGSTMLSLGIAFRFWLAHAGARLAGGVMTILGLFLFGVGASGALGARHFRTTSDPAIVVASEARLLDETGKPRRVDGHTAIPEGEKVYVLEQGSVRAKVEWGTATGWVNRAQLQILHLE